jgi:hypothetical protein
MTRTRLCCRSILMPPWESVADICGGGLPKSDGDSSE